MAAGPKLIFAEFADKAEATVKTFEGLDFAMGHAAGADLIDFNDWQEISADVTRVINAARALAAKARAVSDAALPGTYETLSEARGTPGAAILNGIVLAKPEGTERLVQFSPGTMVRGIVTSAYTPEGTAEERLLGEPNAFVSFIDPRDGCTYRAEFLREPEAAIPEPLERAFATFVAASEVGRSVTEFQLAKEKAAR